MPDSFTDLDVWKIGYLLAIRIYRLTITFPPHEQFGLTSQLRRAANSVIANIAESQGRYSYSDHIRILYLARGEINEVRSHLYIAKGLEYIDSDIWESIDAKYTELIKKLNGFIRHLATKRDQSTH